MKLTKTKADQEKEERDLQNDSALVFLANLEAFKFKFGRDEMAQNHSYVGTQRPYPLTEDNI